MTFVGGGEANPAAFRALSNRCEDQRGRDPC